MKHLLDQLTRLADSGKRLGGIADLEQLHQTILDLITEIFGSYTAAILLKHPRSGELGIVAARGYDPQVVAHFRAGPGHGITGTVLATGEPLLVAETVADPRYVRGVSDAVSEMAIPLRAGQDVIGVLDIESRDQRFSTADLALFSTFGEQVVTAIRNLELQAHLEERARRLVAIARVGQSLTHELDLGRLLARTVEAVREALNLDTAAIQLWDEAGENLVVAAATGFDSDVIGLAVPRGAGVTGRVAAVGEACIIGDVTEVPHYIPGLAGCRSEMAVPLGLYGEVIGVLNLEHRETHRFDETDLLHASIFADQAARAIGNARVAGNLEAARTQTARLSTRLRLLAQTTARINSSTDLDALLDQVLTLARDALGFGRIAVLLPEPSGLHLRVAREAGFDTGTTGRLIPIEGSISGAAYTTARSQLVPEVGEDPRYVKGCDKARSNVAAPLTVEDDVVGVLVAETVGDDVLGEADLEVLEMLAGQVAAAIHGARRRADLAERGRRLTLIHRAACSINTTDDPEEMLESILGLAQKALGLEAAAILTPNAQGTGLVVRKARDHGDVEGLEIAIGHGFVGSMFVTGKAGIIDDIAAEEDYISGTPGARSEMAVPLSLDGETIGILDAESLRPHAFTPADLDLFRIFASQTATALKNARMISALEDRARKLTMIHRASRSLNNASDPEEMLQTILELARQALGLESVAILTPNGDEKFLTVRKALNHGDVEGLRIRIGDGFVGSMFVSGQAGIIDDIATVEGYIPGTPGARSEMAVPLSLDGETIGILDAESLRPHAFSESDLDLFRVFGSQVATALNNARLIDRLRTRGRRLMLLNKASRALSAIHDPTALLDEILATARAALDLDRCALLLADGGSGELVLHAAIGYGDVLGTRLPSGEGIAGQAVASGEPRLASPAVDDARGADRQHAIRCEMAAPLQVQGEVIGALATGSPISGVFDEDDLELLAAFAAQAAVAIHNARLISGLAEANAKLAENVAEMRRLNTELEAYAVQIADANQSLASQVQSLTTLHEAGRAITSSLDLDTTLKAILQMSGRIVGSTASAIKLIDEESKELCIRAEEGSVGDSSRPRTILDLPLKIGDKTIGVFELVREAKQALGRDERQLLETMASQAAIAIENARLFEDTQRVYYETLKSLASALEARDDYTRGHSERVAEISREIATRLGLSKGEIDTIYQAALLHDIGKIGIRDEVLLAPRRLTPEELAIIQKHPTFGNTILLPLKFLGEIREFVRFHHERWDGSGYPEGRLGEDIPLASRIIAVADTYDAMTSTRPYRSALSRDTAIGEIRRSAGSQFDPIVVGTFLTFIEA
jgi:GAF domain-containing protein